MFCINCGKKLNEGSRFCPGCGKPVKPGAATSETPAAAYETAPAGAPETVQAAIREAPVCAPETVNSKKPDRPDRRKKLVLLIVCIAAVVALGAAAGVLVWLNTGPRLTDRLLSRGETCLSEKNYGEAEAAFIKVIEKDPKNSDAYLGLAHVYIGLDDADRAIDALRDGIKAAGDIDELSEMLEELDAGSGVDEAGQIDDWMSQAEDAYDVGYYDEAIELYEKVVAVQPGNVDAVLGLAEACSQAFRFDDMIDAVKAGIEAAPEAEELYYWLADYYYLNGYYSDAIDVLQAGYDATGSEDMLDEIDEIESTQTETGGIPEEALTGSPGGTMTETGFFDPNFDYAANQTYSVAYIVYGVGLLYDSFSDMFSKWAARINCDYTYIAMDNYDADAYISLIESYAAQGINGFLFDPDITFYSRIVEIMDEFGLPWLGVMASPMDEYGNLIHPTVTINHDRMGTDMAFWAIDYAQRTWQDALDNEIGMISVDFSVVPLIHERTIGAMNAWNQSYPQRDGQFFTADASGLGMIDSDTGYDIVSAVIAANPGIKYWLICACFDEYAVGAVQAAEAFGIENNCVVVSCGGTGLIEQWDSGGDSCWKAAVYTDVSLYTEPMICGLYAMMSGQATAETLWPEWVDTAAGDHYATLNPPSMVITRTNYQEYLEWVDAYTGQDVYDYPYGGTQYPPRETADY